MSEITDVKKKKDLALKKYGAQPEGTSLLWADQKLVDDLEEVVQFLNSDRLIDGMLMPRFGVLSLILRTTPTYVYGHPAFKKMCKTAFTDGTHVFICDEFYEKLLQDCREAKGAEYGIEPLILHELMHKMFNHVQRLHQFPKQLANKAADLSINTKLRSGFPEIEWCKSLRETGLGFKPGDIEKYLPLAEESIARELMAEELKEQKKKEQQNQQNQNGQPQQGQGQGGKPQKGQGGGQPQPGQGDPSDGDSDGDQQDQEAGSDFNGDDDDHLHSLKDVIEALEDAGLDEVKEILNLPDSDEAEEIARVQQENEQRQHEAMQQAIAQSQQCGGKYPGQHIVDAAAEYMKGFSKGKLSWKMALREMVLGDGMKFRPSFENVADIAFVDEVSDDLGTPLYLPTELTHKAEETVLVLIDTSGSVSSDDIRAFLTEIFELKTASENNGDSASEVLVISADTVMRGEIVEINDDNVDEMMSQGMKIFGRGGTDLGHSLKTALQLPIMKEKKIRAVIYCTDLYDSPPRYADLGVPDGTSIVYVAAPSTHSSHVEEFARAVESYARVVEIKDGQEVDLEDAKNMSVSPKARR